MMEEQQDKYSEWLKAIEQTRLMFNTRAEFYDFLNPDAKQSNGIDRAYPTPVQKRNAFRVLKVEAEKMTNGVLQLEDLLEDYKKASDFYMEYFSRRQSQDLIAKQLLDWLLKGQSLKNLPSRSQEDFIRLEKEKINVFLLVLLLLNALPGYDSKRGDVKDIDDKWTKVVEFLEDFTKDNGMFESSPLIIKAKDERNKCRIMLIYHLSRTIDFYSNIVHHNSLPKLVKDGLDALVDLDLSGFWNEFEGGFGTLFWLIEKMDKPGTFSAVKWHKKNNMLSKESEHVMLLMEGGNGVMLVVFVNEAASYDFVEGKAFADSDLVIYRTAMPSIYTPEHLPLERFLSSDNWPKSISLTRVTDTSIISCYDDWIKKYNDLNPESVSDDDYSYSVLLIIDGKLYINDDEEDIFYYIPKDKENGISNIDFNRFVGIVKHKGKRYIEFADRALFIPIESSALSKYGIEIVHEIKEHKPHDL